MIKSMTGYAHTEASGTWGDLVWELRSVNHRYLDVSLRVPEALRATEANLRSLATAALGRGKVECTLRYNAQAAAGDLQIDEQRLAALARATARVAQTLDMSAPLNPLQLLRWPGVAREPAADMQVLAGQAQTAFARALEQLVQTKNEEGEKLDAFFGQRLQDLDAALTALEQRLPQVRDQWRDRLEARLADLEQPVDPGRLEQEAVIAAQKADVEEELSRLRMHMDAFVQALDKPEPIGRRLDFLMQEFNREANTLSSKSQDARLRQQAVDIKVIIEQMREQVQNVE